MSFDLVLFGGTGDLTWRKLMPALFQAWRHGKLPGGGRILAVARDDRSDAEYRQFIKERFVEVESAKRPSDDEFARFATDLQRLRTEVIVNQFDDETILSQSNMEFTQDAEFVPEQYGIALKKGNAELLAKVNQGLAGIKADGSYDKNFAQYFGAAPAAAAAPAPAASK